MGDTYTIKVPRIEPRYQISQGTPSYQLVQLTYRPKNRSTSTTNRIQRDDIRHLTWLEYFHQRSTPILIGALPTSPPKKHNVKIVCRFTATAVPMLNKQKARVVSTRGKADVNFLVSWLFTITYYIGVVSGKRTIRGPILHAMTKARVQRSFDSGGIKHLPYLGNTRS